MTGICDQFISTIGPKSEKLALAINQGAHYLLLEDLLSFQYGRVPLIEPISHVERTAHLFCRHLLEKGPSVAPHDLPPSCRHEPLVSLGN